MASGDAQNACEVAAEFEHSLQAWVVPGVQEPTHDGGEAGAWMSAVTARKDHGLVPELSIRSHRTVMITTRALHFRSPVPSSPAITAGNCFVTSI